MSTDDKKVLERKSWSHRHNDGLFWRPFNHTLDTVFITSTATRHRKKPSPLTDTPFEFYRYSTPFLYESVYDPPTASFPHESCLFSGVHWDSSLYIVTKSNDSTLALNRARSKVSDFNFGETVVEFKETWSMIEDHSYKLVRLFQDVRSGYFAKHGIRGSVAKSLGKIPADRRLAKGWLLFSFGWMPLISDIYSGIEAYNSKALEAGEVIRRRSGSKPSRLKDPDGNFTNMIDKNTIHSSASFRGTVRKNGTIGANLNRLGLANPLLMAWNYLPFSFLVDWFLPISPLLGALTSNLGLEDIQENITERRLEEQYADRVYSPYHFPLSIPAYQKYFANRKGASDSPPEFNLFKDVNFGLWKVATSVALVREVLMGRK